MSVAATKRDRSIFEVPEAMRFLAAYTTKLLDLADQNGAVWVEVDATPMSKPRLDFAVRLYAADAWGAVRCVASHFNDGHADWCAKEDWAALSKRMKEFRDEQGLEEPHQGPGEVPQGLDEGVQQERRDL